MSENKIQLKRGWTILFDGDSATSRRTLPCLDNWPFLRLSNWHRTYADNVSEWLFCNRPDLNLKFRNVAVGGAKCHQMLSRFDEFVLPVKPSLVILTIGGNDSNVGIPLKEFTECFREYCKRLSEQCQAKVLQLGGCKPCPQMPPNVAEKRKKRMPYHRECRKILREFGGAYFDVSVPLAKKAKQLHKQHPIHTVYSDGFHINAVGNEIITAQVLQQLGVITINE